jgi:hypothetical protein
MSRSCACGTLRKMLSVSTISANSKSAQLIDQAELVTTANSWPQGCSARCKRAVCVAIVLSLLSDCC